MNFVALRLRFSIAHLFIAFTLVSIFLVAIVLFARAKKRGTIIDVYGSREVYEVLRQSHELEVFRVRQKGLFDSSGVQANFLEDLVTIRCGNVRIENVPQLRDLLTSPENLRHQFYKDYIFRPKLLLRATVGAKQVDIYFDFEIDEAAVVLDGRRVGVLQTDRVSKQLHGLIASSCDNN